MVAIDKHPSHAALITADYDQHADVLYVLTGDPRPAEGEDLPGGIVRRYALDDAAPCGVTVIGYHRNRRHRKPRQLAKIVAEHLGADAERSGLWWRWQRRSDGSKAAGPSAENRNYVSAKAAGLTAKKG